MATTPLREQVRHFQEIVDEVQSVLENVYRPEATREELAEAVGKALDVIEPDDADADEDDEDDEDDASDAP